MTEEDYKKYITEIIDLYTKRNELDKKDVSYRKNVDSIEIIIGKLSNSILDYEQQYEKNIEGNIRNIEIDKEKNIILIKNIKDTIKGIYENILELQKDKKVNADEIIKLCSDAEKEEEKKKKENYKDTTFSVKIDKLKNELSNFENKKNNNYRIYELLIDIFEIKNNEIYNDENKKMYLDNINDEIKRIQKEQLFFDSNDEKDLKSLLDFGKKLTNKNSNFDKVLEYANVSNIILGDRITDHIEYINKQNTEHRKMNMWLNNYLKETLVDGDCFYSAIFRGLRDIKKITNENKVTIYGIEIKFDENEKEEIMKLRNIVKSNLPTYEEIINFDNDAYTKLEELKKVILKERNWAEGIEKDIMNKILKEYLNINLFSFNYNQNIDAYDINDPNNLYLYNPNNAIHFRYFFDDKLNDGKKRHSIKRRKSIKRRQSLKRRSKRKSIKRHSVKRRK